MTVRIYLDAAPVIYSVQQVPVYGAAVDERLSETGIVCVASDLTRLECRVKPMRDADADLLKEFDDYFAGAVAEIVALSSGVIDRATTIRARYGFKTPDSIHLAAALTAGCDVFFTNDHRLASFNEISIEVLQP